MVGVMIVFALKDEVKIAIDQEADKKHLANLVGSIRRCRAD